MFRQTLCLLPLFLAAVPQTAAVINRVASYQLCTGNVSQYVSPIGQGGFSFPLFGGACPVATGTEPVGVLSGTCSQNPYAGRAMAYIRDASFPVVPAMGQGGGLGKDEPTIGEEVDMQALANGWCLGANGPSAPTPLESLCYADLAVRGTDVKTKNLGSKLGFTFNARTTYRFVGAIYNTEMRSTLTQTSAAAVIGVATPGSLDTVTSSVQQGLECGGAIGSCVGAVVDTTYTDPTYSDADFVETVQLLQSTAFVSITCQYVAASITSTEGGMPFEGSGKYTQPSLNKHVAGIDQVLTRVTPLPVVANPTNVVLNSPDIWRTQLTVRYNGKGYVNYTQL